MPCWSLVLRLSCSSWGLCQERKHTRWSQQSQRLKENPLKSGAFAGQHCFMISGWINRLMTICVSCEMAIASYPTAKSHSRIDLTAHLFQKQTQNWILKDGFQHRLADTLQSYKIWYCCHFYFSNSENMIISNYHLLILYILFCLSLIFLHIWILYIFGFLCHSLFKNIHASQYLSHSLYWLHTLGDFFWLIEVFNFNEV